MLSVIAGSQERNGRQSLNAQQRSFEAFFYSLVACCTQHTHIGNTETEHIPP